MSSLSRDELAVRRYFTRLNKHFSAPRLERAFERRYPDAFKDHNGQIYINGNYRNIHADYCLWLTDLYDAAMHRSRFIPNTALSNTRSLCTLGVLKPADIYTSLILESGFDAGEVNELLFNL